MGKASVTYRELRFIVEPELTQVYVLCEAEGDAPLGVQGWHHKTFPPSMTVEKILGVMLDSDHCLTWPQAVPPK